MMKFALVCNNSHKFEGWFRDNDGYDTQKAAREITCPQCNSPEVEKAIMAPNIAKGSKDHSSVSPEQFRNALRELRRRVESLEDVGDRFPEEIRAGRAGIRGDAPLEEIRRLLDEGHDIVPVPNFPKLDS